MRRVPRDPSPELPPPPVQQPPPVHESSDDDQYIPQTHVAQPVQSGARYDASPHHQSTYTQPNPPPMSHAPPPQQTSLADRDRNDRVSDPAKLPFSQRVNLFKQSQSDQPRQDYKNYIKYVSEFISANIPTFGNS